MQAPSHAIVPPSERVLALVQALRQRLAEPEFLARHRRHPKAFRRHRVLAFPLVFLMILQKTVKSLQLHLHEFLAQWQDAAAPPTVGASAFTHARAKLGHQAYVELNEQVLLPLVYGPEPPAALRRWQGHRVLAIDSSLIRLPVTRKLDQVFGRVECSNHRGKSSVAYPAARISVLYDVLNQIGWSACLEPHTTAETELARRHLSDTRAGDLVLCDRGYAGFLWLALLRQAGVDFVVRCSQGSFAAVQELFQRNQADRSVEVVLSAGADIKKHLRQLGLPLTLRVRLVTLRLVTGELEVLATSLRDPQRYPTEAFAQVYHWRWGIETYYGRLKGRLDLENWSGKTEAAIRQDFHATVLLSNLESVITWDVAAALPTASAERKHALQVNRAVSFHALKSQLIALLTRRQPIKTVVIQLQALLLANPVGVRVHRQVPRRKPPPGQSYHYQRNLKKSVF